VNFVLILFTCDIRLSELFILPRAEIEESTTMTTGKLNLHSCKCQYRAYLRILPDERFYYFPPVLRKALPK